ncbi:cell division protein FtsQ/DivIB [Salipiger sp. 1_MG-2023]|uniref:cell division protein FtsQ/DivIB n=1 Tax=Salipiger sp. 1_MG-2023 TaxID=3062665 RepID=UPI0026E27F45|nr:cell division protein FtsQ/DivIB [Salipiger sp. 1_MG-2023]MDO6586100.1 cell division protein FtsQ/DivIB [Salipiger sp. 1_MG-2023]
MRGTPEPQFIRPDPAPSRLTYRIERLMLTPLFRLGLHVGLPALIAIGAAGWYFSYESHRTQIVETYGSLRNEIQNRPEFRVNLMAIDGASITVAEDIREVLTLDFPISSFDLDLDTMREQITGLDAVQSASLRIRSGGVLQVDVVERVPVVLWRSGAGLELLDKTGVHVGPVESRADYPGLPVIAGVGADAHVSEAVALVRAASPLAARLRGLERMGGRRWDVVLDRGQRILLPEDNAVQALERAIAMDQAVDMLGRDIAAVDLRLPRRPTLRLTRTGQEEYWRIKAMETGEKQQ